MSQLLPAALAIATATFLLAGVPLLAFTIRRRKTIRRAPLSHQQADRQYKRTRDAAERLRNFGLLATLEKAAPFSLLPLAAIIAAGLLARVLPRDRTPAALSELGTWVALLGCALAVLTIAAIAGTRLLLSIRYRWQRAALTPAEWQEAATRATAAAAAATPTPRRRWFSLRRS